MSLTLAISPHGRAHLESDSGDGPQEGTFASERRIRAAFEPSPASGMLHLATSELRSPLSASLSFAREFSRMYLTRLCCHADLEGAATPAPSEEELESLALSAPPMTGLEYFNAGILADWWGELDLHVQQAIRDHGGGARAWLRDVHPSWREVGRVTFHLAENKRDESLPFAFLSTYVSRLSGEGRAQHVPLARALQEDAGKQNRAALVSLLAPIHRAAERLPWVQEMVESGGLYQALAWSPAQAHRFLQDIPALQACGLAVRMPNWWKPNHPPRPQVSVKLGDRAASRLGTDALLDYSVNLSLEGEPLTADEMRELLHSSGGLVRLRGGWVEVDAEKLAEALEHWRKVEDAVGREGVSMREAMRLLAGVGLGGGVVESFPESLRAWTGVAPGEWFHQLMSELNHPEVNENAAPPELRATLRPYQHAGVHWLRLTTGLGLGACLADDMGLGKTVQVLALLLHLKSKAEVARPSLLVLPASLIANWKAEAARFAPALTLLVAHPSESTTDLKNAAALRKAVRQCDVVVTTYGMLSRLQALREQAWNLVVLDEAQAIKNSGARQTRAVKALSAAARIALTGTPVENRLSDLWSLFNFLNPGLLGDGKTFARLAKSIEKNGAAGFGPLRALVGPYILRRLKTDKAVIADLPDKTEVRAWCGLSKQQAALYQASVHELAQRIEGSEGIGRRGLVLAYLMRFKQICNHPGQFRGDGDYTPDHSGKFQRLAEICEELASRQEKALVFTQFREMADPLADFLQSVFKRSGLVLHGGTAVGKRREMVEAFQCEDGPPFFVLSLKAGGTGLNLTAACHVIHFDRWWNPAVENQATDRAFRIGQTRNVMVHKFICRGTIEEKIDQMIADKIELAEGILGSSGEKMLTEMDNDELLDFVSLDIHKATSA